MGKGERLANLVARRRTLLVLDGLEPLQYPPGPQEAFSSGTLTGACGFQPRALSDHHADRSG
jgi:hypothetical protein